MLSSGLTKDDLGCNNIWVWLGQIGIGVKMICWAKTSYKTMSRAQNCLGDDASFFQESRLSTFQISKRTKNARGVMFPFSKKADWSKQNTFQISKRTTIGQLDNSSAIGNTHQVSREEQNQMISLRTEKSQKKRPTGGTVYQHLATFLRWWTANSLAKWGRFSHFQF